MNTYKKAEENIRANNIEKKDISTNQGESGEEISETDDDSFIENAIQQAFGGAFYEGETNWLGTFLSLLISFVPGLNCAADFRDLIADGITVFSDGELTLKEAGLLALDIITLAGDAISLGVLVKGIKGATKTTKLAKTAAKQSAKSTKQAAKKAGKAAAKAQKEAAEKTTRKTTRKALKTTKAADKAQKESKAAKEAAKQASKEHRKAVTKETKQAVKEGTKKNVKKEVKDYKENTEKKVTEKQIKKQYKSETRAESKASNEAKINSAYKIKLFHQMPEHSFRPNPYDI